MHISFWLITESYAIESVGEIKDMVEGKLLGKETTWNGVKNLQVCGKCHCVLFRELPNQNGVCLSKLRKVGFSSRTQSSDISFIYI